MSQLTARSNDRLAYQAPAEMSAPAAPAIELAELTKRFAPRRRLIETLRRRGRAPRVTVVDRVSFTIAPGEIFGLLGPNGAGKTTIFKMLGTMIVPDGGSATVSGYDVVHEAAGVRRVLAAVPADERSLNWRLSALENLRLFAALHTLPAREGARRAEQLLEVVGLRDARAKLVGAFSSGMRQRLLIARALIGAPTILLLDEPTRSLDPLSAQEFRDFLRRDVVGRQGCTIVIATHNTDEAFSFCDRVAVLHQGRMLAAGPTTTLAARFGEERYRLLTSGGGHQSLLTLERTGWIRELRDLGEASPGWRTLECVIPGGPQSTSVVIGEVVARGAAIARLERIEMSLADLIRRIIATEPGARDA